MRNLEDNTFALKLVTFEDDEGPILEVLPYMFVPLDTDLSDFEAFKRNLYFEADLWGPARVDRHKEDISFEMFEHAALELATKLQFDDRLSFGHSSDIRDPYFMPALLATALHRERRGEFGLPFIEHPRSVVLKAEVALVENSWTDRDFESGLCAAWLQNIFSTADTSFYRKIDAVDLSDWGVSDETLEILDLLTWDEETLSEIYFARVLSNSTARAIKLAELAQLIWSQRAADGYGSKYDKELSALGYHPEVDEWMPTLMTTELLSGWPRYGLTKSEQIAEAQIDIPARFRFERADMDALDSLAWGPGPENLQATTASDDQLAVALFCGYFGRFNKIQFNLETLETEWRFRGAVGKQVEPRFLSSASVSLQEIQARATRTFANQARFVAALYGSQFEEDNGFFRPFSGDYSLLDVFTNDELAEMTALGMTSKFGEQPYGHEFKTLLGAILQRSSGRF
jgi:hypothetical protein